MDCHGCGKPLTDLGRNGQRKYHDYKCRPYYVARLKAAILKTLNRAVKQLKELP